MDCRRFRNNHAPFVDLRCSVHEEGEMRMHMRECPVCARHDMVVRRSLMLVKSLPTIETSPDFGARLDARLRASPREVTPRRSRISYVVVAAAAAGVMFMTYLATDTLRTGAPREIRLAPVVASAPESEPSPVATSGFVATVPTGMSVWPAIMVASQATIHFVAAEMATER